MRGTLRVAAEAPVEVIVMGSGTWRLLEHPIATYDGSHTGVRASTADPPSDSPMPLIRHLSPVGLFVGVMFFAFSLTPSLLPRSFAFQGLVSGVSLTLGYALGICGRWLWSYLEIPVPGARTQRVMKLLAAVTGIGIAATFLWLAAVWQNSLRTLMNMPEVSGVQPLGVAFMALLGFVTLLLVARLFGRAYVFLSDTLHRFLPRRVSNVLGVIAAAVLLWAIMNGVIFSLTLRVADESYQQVETIVQDDTGRPDDPLKTGSLESFVTWRDLGAHGRSFLSSGPTTEQLSAFHGAATPAPIRVYVGLNAAETPEARARIALRELVRVGAFERSVLLLVTPSGTGWTDPAALDSVEYLHRGDIATVAVQYSYLPSPLALIVEGAYGADTARALFDEVYGHWTQLPKDQRPSLYLHGVSLGALNSELSFHTHDILADPFQGALWAGPPFRSEQWNEITARRDPGSPAWLPRFRGGSVVRFMNQNGGLETPTTEWGSFRLAYLQYASDPLTFFSVRSFYKEPEWLREPRGPDVSPAFRWFPIVTMVQLAADMPVAGAAPPGYGHNFAAEDYIEAWLALTEPKGWTKDAIRRLKAVMIVRQAA